MRAIKAICTTIAIITLLCACGAESNVKKGDAFYAIGEYFDAAAEYKKAYTRTPSKEKEKRGERAWKMAECYRRINYTAKAMAAYQNAIRYKYQDSMKVFYLAQMQHKTGDYKNAEKNYQLFLDSVPDHKMAQIGLLGIKQAQKWKNNPTLHTVKRHSLFNGRRADFSPVLTGDEWDEVFFTSTRPQATGDELNGITGTKSADVFHSKRDDQGKWGQPELCEGEVNSEYEEGACCFSPDGKTMYITRCTYDSDYPRFAEIYTSQRSDASWSKPQKLELTSDTLSCYAHPAVSPDGKWLYFVSDMPGGMGGLDIWRIAIGENGMGGVENVGEPINTEGDEMFPTFRPNGELYFSSNGHPGMGGLDLFCAKRDTTDTRHETWNVENLMWPMNSSGDDFGMTFEGVHNRGYFSSNRGDGRGYDHIYTFECPEVLQTIKGWVYEKDGYELPEGLVYMVGNDGTNLKISVRGDGSFEQVVNPKVQYVLLGTCKGYLNHKEELYVDTSHVSREYVLQFPLASINTPVLVRNVFYEFDSAKLTESSTMALDSLADLLHENPNITIELSSHCDYRGADAYNLRLSQRRAESVVKYLVEHGIAMERLTPVGYGETRPKIVTRKMAERNPFLHEGDTLTEAFIMKFENPDHQEICNAYNRRTEFRVLRTTYQASFAPTAEEVNHEEEEEDGASPARDEDGENVIADTQEKKTNKNTHEAIPRLTEENP
ncbi:MAG: OmpA family protein [Bacteroidaceae bacterium]|nr:OmpA family protein [Bacteroidaceae bacterium]